MVINRNTAAAAIVETIATAVIGKPYMTKHFSIEIIEIGLQKNRQCVQTLLLVLRWKAYTCTLRIDLLYVHPFFTKETFT